MTNTLREKYLRTREEQRAFVERLEKEDPAMAEAVREILGLEKKDD